MDMTKESTDMNSTTSTSLLRSGVLGQVFKKRLYGGVFAVVFILSGCASSLPGGYKTYCISLGSTKGIEADYKYASYDYERYRELSLSDSGTKCNVQGLHPMTLRWKRIGGDPRKITLDIATLMKDMKQRQDKRFPRSKGWPDIELEYEEGQLAVLFVIYSAIPRKFGRNRNEYTLTTIELN